MTNAEGQIIKSTSNVAPGSEVNVRVRSASGTSPSFIKTAEAGTVNVDGTWSTEFEFSGQNIDNEYTVSVRKSILDENLEVDGTAVEQVQAPAVFEVSDLSPQDVTVTSGDAIDVSATIENTGEQSATQTVEFRVGGDAVADQEVELGGGSSTTVEFTGIDTSGIEAGDYEHGVSTDGGSQTATLTVEAADGDDGDMDGDDSDMDGDDSDMDGDDSDIDGDDGMDGNDTDGEDGAIDDETPGFGAIVALVASNAAATLATLRPSAHAGRPLAAFFITLTQ